MFKPRSLQFKLNFFFIANAISILVIFLVFTNTIITRVLERQIRESLAAGKSTITQLLGDREERLKVGASLMAIDYGFKQAYSSDDLATINSALVNLKNRIQANFVSLVDLDGQVYASTVTHADLAALEIRKLVAGYGDSGEVVPWSATRVLQGKLFQIVFVPFLAPDLVKWTAVGFEINADLAGAFKNISATDIIFAVKATEKFTSYASTLDAESTPKLLDFLAKNPDRNFVKIGDKHYYFAESGSNENRSIIVLKETSAIFNLMDTANYICLGLFFVLLATSVVFSQFISRMISRPIQDITDKSKRLAAGELGVDLSTDLGDESVRELSRSLQRMTTALKSEISKKIDAMREVKEKQALIKSANSELQKKSSESALLKEILARVKESKEAGAFFDYALDRILKNYGFGRVSILGVLHADKNLKPLVVRTEAGEDPNFARIKTLNTGLSLVDLTIPELRYLFHHMPDDWCRALASGSYIYYEVRATDDTCLAIPLRISTHARGFLHIIDNSGRKLGEDDISLLCSVADVLAPLVYQLSQGSAAKGKQ